MVNKALRKITFGPKGRRAFLINKTITVLSGRETSSKLLGRGKIGGNEKVKTEQNKAHQTWCVMNTKIVLINFTWPLLEEEKRAPLTVCTVLHLSGGCRGICHFFQFGFLFCCSAISFLFGFSYKCCQRMVRVYHFQRLQNNKDSYVKTMNANTVRFCEGISGKLRKQHLHISNRTSNTNHLTVIIWYI